MRYARALLDVSIEEGDPRKVEQELLAFRDLLSHHQELSRVLSNPAVPVGRKRAVVSELLDRVRISPAVEKLLLLLAQRDRLSLLPHVADTYSERLLDYLGIVRAEVTTAVPLPEDRLKAIEDRLSEMTGRKVLMSLRVDPGIIGGIVTRIGSVVYDGSVTRQLERMQEALAAGA
jgi:F-type H+-transporting ATPase subunit delta